jgi:hypothetical protein
MEDAVECFHPFQDVFILGRASRRPEATANALRTELVKKRNVDENTNSGDGTACKKRHELNTGGIIIATRL